ncbi:hypothetical protein CLV40_13944 [Actinokineospora auranticolor]|uniref:Uncharacterized protein n=1 Tax=Actinokineospora auranticolor TaxID=155976 RepID=A0A2S6GBV8_9PSEU|nr:hypothetical protein CLV40_13944 [Actinokineospora auranticolor]
MESDWRWPAAAASALLVVFGTLAFLTLRWLLA